MQRNAMRMRGQNYKCCDTQRKDILATNVAAKYKSIIRLQSCSMNGEIMRSNTITDYRQQALYASRHVSINQEIAALEKHNCVLSNTSTINFTVT